VTNTATNTTNTATNTDPPQPSPAFYLPQMIFIRYKKVLEIVDRDMMSRDCVSDMREGGRAKGDQKNFNKNFVKVLRTAQMAST
jgi:hypothetical protein